MAIANFGIVIAGINVPASEFDLSHYEFRGQHLKESFRAPVALQAEAPGISLQILPERCQIIVSAPGDLDEDASEVTTIANSIFEYVGERVVKAVGHNMQYVIEGTSGRKLESIAKLLRLEAVNAALDHPLLNADLTFYVRLNNESMTRVVVMSQADPSRLILDFNVNFERDASPARAAVNNLGESLAKVNELAMRLGAELSGDGFDGVRTV